MVPRGDGLLGGDSHSITVRCSIGWPYVHADHLRPLEDLHDGLNSTCPGRRVPLIRYLGAEVMPKCPSRVCTLPVGTGASAPKDSISSASLYSFSPSMSLRGDYSSSFFSSSWSCCCCSFLLGVPWAAGLPGTTSFIPKGSSS
jgi:hypothetical protein